MSPLIRTLILLDQGPTLTTSFNCNYFLEVPTPNTATLGITAAMYELGGHEPSVNTVCDLWDLLQVI